MRIALVSAEYSGEAHSGGIGTYMRNVADMMSARGHEVEVFTAGNKTGSTVGSDGTRIHTVACRTRGEFPGLIAPMFSSRHMTAPFDVAEGAEFLAETRGVAKVAPDLALVLKLHTPMVLIHWIDAPSIPRSAKARFVFGGLRRGRLVKPYWHYDPATDFERDNLRTASEITAPCRGIVRALEAVWPLNPEEIRIIPNVFVAPAIVTKLAAETRTRVITFIGRLENRKGVFDLATAIPLVLREMRDVKFRFVGRSLKQPGTELDIRELLRAQLKSVSASVEFIDSVPYNEVHQYYAACDVCVLPSIWENFPNVCLEAMAAARGVIGSSAGGMAEIIEHGRTGLLVPPRNPKAIAEALLTLLRDPERRIAMGRAAREHVTTAYAPDVIAPLQEASYKRAIERVRERRAV